MRLTRLEAATESLDALVSVVKAEGTPVLLAGTMPVLWAAALSQRAPVSGVWLRPSADYPAALAARDVATLAWITPLSHVVIEAQNAAAHAAALGALLTNDEVNFSNEVASLRGAYNRPAPPRGLRVWRLEGAQLVSEQQSLAAQAPRESGAGVLVDYAD